MTRRRAAASTTAAGRAMRAPRLTPACVCSHAGRERGLTLVEIMVTLSIIVMAAVIVVPAVSSVTRAELRGAAGKLAGTVRATYNAAALSGRTHRIVFEIGKPLIKVEAAVDSGPKGADLLGLASMLGGGGGLGGDGDSGDKSDSSSGDGAAAEVQPPAEILALLGMPAASAGDDDDDHKQKRSSNDDVPPGESAGLATFESTNHDLTLDGEVRVLDVWIEGMGKPVDEGTVYLSFFSHGYTQNALIHLTDGDSNVYTVKVNALTGRAEVLESYVEAPK